MMKKWGVLGAVALLLLVGAFVLWRMIGGTTEVSPELSSTAQSPEEGRIGGPTDRRPVAAPAAPRIGAGSSGEKPAANDTGGEIPEMKIEPIKRAYIQREDGTLRGKDAPPPLFRKDTVDAIRAAVTPAVQKCMKEGLARIPDNAHLENSASVAVIYTVSATGGQVGVTKAEAVINGTQDDALLPCIEAAYSSVRFQAPAQPDGEGKVQAVFDLK